MTSRWMNLMLALLALAVALVFAAGPASAWAFSDFQVNGAGTAGGTCQAAMTPIASGCVSNSGGDVIGGVLPTGAGTYTLSLTAGTAIATNSESGTCLPANSTGQIVAGDGSVINFKTVGWICEESFASSNYHYNGTYRIDSGTGQFATAAGGGSLAATFVKGLDGPTFMKMNGTISY